MNDAIFIYKKGSQFKVLNLDEPAGKEKKLKDDGWKHIETLSASVWLETLLTVSQRNRKLMLEDIIYRDI